MRADRPLLAVEISPRTARDAERLDRALQALSAEDPSLAVERRGDGVRLGAIGEQHVEIVIDRLAREFGVEAAIGHLHIVLDNGLEPVMWIEVTVPDEYSRPLAEDLVRREGRIEIDELRGRTRVIAAVAPLSQLLGYAGDLRGRTQGRGSFTMTRFGYR
jgi:translation elongation factor EF-G